MNTGPACPRCGEKKYVYARTCRACTEFVAAEQHPQWTGGRCVTDQGYIYVHAPGHSRASKNGYVYEHILIAERALGRPLPDTAEVHHGNEVRSDNRPGNLVICEGKGYHALLHARMRAYVASGDANAKRCRFCKVWQSEPAVTMAHHGWSYYHRACRNRHLQWQRRLERVNG